jgi:hypothetical protein
MGIRNSDKHVMRYFVLPLYNVKYNDIKEVYVSAYLDKKGDNLFIEFLADFEGLASNKLFTGIFPINNKDYNVLSTDIIHATDVKLIIEGRYSEMSQLAKKKIIKLSELEYRQKTDKGTERTSELLLALFKHPSHRKKIEEATGVKLSDTSELISKLQKCNYIEEIINQEL